MDRTNPAMQDLIEKAIQDAGLSAGDVEVVVVDAAPDPTRGQTQPQASWPMRIVTLRIGGTGSWPIRRSAMSLGS